MGLSAVAWIAGLVVSFADGFFGSSLLHPDNIKLASSVITKNVFICILSVFRIVLDMKWQCNVANSNHLDNFVGFPAWLATVLP